MKNDFGLTLDDVPALDSTPTENIGEQSATTEAAPASPEPSMHEYQASGKTITEDINTILKRASQGYNYAQNITEHKANVTSFNQERDGHIAEFGQWKQYHDYATDNPEWAEFVKGKWDERTSFGQAEPAVQEGHQTSQMNPEVQRFMDEYRNDKKLRQESDEDSGDEDSALNESIKATQTAFPEFDLTHTDPDTGISVEMKVLEHARAHGINSFEAAFKDVMFDEIVNRKVTASKEAAAKEITDRQKTGFISQSETSLANLTSPQRKSTGGGSYHDLVMDGAREMGILN